MNEKLKRFLKRPWNWVLIIISPVLLFSGWVCMLVILGIGSCICRPVIDTFFSEKPFHGYLKNNEYKIIKFERWHHDIWGEKELSWHLRFPKGFNSLDAIPDTFDVECLDYNVHGNWEGENGLASFLMESMNSNNFLEKGKIYIVHPDPGNSPTRCLFYFPGKDSEDLFIVYRSR